MRFPAGYFISDRRLAFVAADRTTSSPGSDIDPDLAMHLDVMLDMTIKAIEAPGSDIPPSPAGAAHR